MPYCTYLTIYKGNKLPPFYIGFSTVDNVLKGYHGSVLSKKYKQIWEQELKDHSNLFKTQVITIHQNINAARSKEGHFLRRLKVSWNPLYINQRACQYADQTGRIPWNKGLSWSDEIKKKMKKPHPSMYGSRNAAGNKGKSKSESHRQNIGNALRGKLKSEEAKANMSTAQQAYWIRRKENARAI